MSERKEVGDSLSIHARPSLQPVAAPVNTYVRPAEPVRGKGDALLNAISQLDQSLSPVLIKETKQAARKEYERGQELFEQNRRDFAEAVRSGEIRMGASPFVRRGYRESQLGVLGATYNIELQRALEHSNLSEIDNPAEVEEFIGEFRQKFIEENNLQGMPKKEVARVFSPMARRAQDNFRNQQADRNIQFVEEKRIRAFEMELHMAISQGRFSGPPGSATADAKSLSQWIQARAQQAYEEGIDYKVIEKAILVGVGEAALANGSISTANVLNQINVAGLGPLGASSAGRKVRQRVTSAVARREEARNRAARSASNKASKARLQEMGTEIMAARRAGDIGRAEELIAEMSTMSAKDARTWENWVDGERNEIRGEADAAGLDSTIIGIRGAGSLQEAEDMILENTELGVLSPEDASKARAHAEGRFRSRPAEDPVTIYEGDGMVSDLERGISDYFPKTVYGTPDPNHAANVARATSQYQDEMIDWIGQNTDADGNYDRVEAARAAREAQQRAVEINTAPAIEAPTAPTETPATEPARPRTWYEWAFD